jgi:osmoprotectant transport system substrate-binding protein
LALSGCSTSDPLDTPSESAAPSSSGDAQTIVIGSQQYYSNTIIAEIWAQALENDGFTVTRQFDIGQRDAYLPALESGEVQLFPEYTGNLLQYYSPDTTATKSDDVYAELAAALPDNLTVLDQSSATDQDSYNVTADFAKDNGLTSLADLKGIDGLILGGNAELEERPYGPEGLKSTYGVDVSFTATGDTTVASLIAGEINIANVYSADPAIGSNGFVTLADPEGLFLSSNVVPLVNKDVADSIADTINAISAKLTPEGLVALNVESQVDEKSNEDIATGWLTDNGFLS